MANDVEIVLLVVWELYSLVENGEVASVLNAFTDNCEFFWLLNGSFLLGRCHQDRFTSGKRTERLGNRGAAAAAKSNVRKRCDRVKK